MKKILFLLSGIAILFSCSNDDGGSNPDNFLVKKAVSVAADGTEGMTFNYSYNGNKINTIQVLDGHKIVYFYTGNLITKMERYFSDNGTLEFEVNYEYDDNERLSKEESKYFPNSSVSTQDFTYEADGTVSFLVYSGEIGSTSVLVSSGKYFFNENNEVIKIATNNLNSDTEVVVDFTYDNKNSSFKNVLGWNKLLSNRTGKNNNILTVTTMDESQTVIDSYENLYEYNNSGYPTSVTTTLGSTTSTTNYFY